MEIFQSFPRMSFYVDQDIQTCDQERGVKEGAEESIYQYILYRQLGHPRLFTYQSMHSPALFFQRRHFNFNVRGKIGK